MQIYISSVTSHVSDYLDVSDVVASAAPVVWQLHLRIYVIGSTWLHSRGHATAGKLDSLIQQKTVVTTQHSGSRD